MASKKNGIELATAYVSVTTDTSKLTDELADGLDDAVTKAGAPAGEKLGKEMGDAASKEVVKKLDKKQLGAALQKGGLAVGAAAGAGIVLGLKSAIDQSDIEGSIRAQLGTTPAIAAAVAKDARAVFNAGWGDDLATVASITAITKQQVDLAGGGGDLEALTTQAIALSSEFGDESQKIIESAAQLVKNGMAPTMAAAMDTITSGYQSSSRMSEDWLDTITEYSTQFRGLGLTAQDAAGLISQGLEAGARNGDQVADSLKEFWIRAQDGSKATTEGFAAIGLDGQLMGSRIAAGGADAKAALGETLTALRAIEDPTKRNAAAVQLFGTKAEDLGDALFALDTGKLSTVDISGSAAKFAIDARSFDQSISAISRSLSDALGAALLPLLPTIQAFADSFLGVFGWLSENPVVTTILLAIASAIGVIAAAQWIWNAAQYANPTVLILMGIILAVGLVVAAVVALATNWDSVMAGLARGVIIVIGIIDTLLQKLGSVFGQSWGLGVDLPTIVKANVPGAANGGTVGNAGVVRVGEFGPENLYLPSAATVHPLPDSGGSSTGTGRVVNLKIVNPQAEPTSKTVASAHALVGAALGV